MYKCTYTHETNKSFVTVFSPEPLSVAVHYSFHSEHYTWVWYTTSSKTSTMSSILSYRYYVLVAMREDGISGKAEHVKIATNRDIRSFSQFEFMREDAQFRING